LLNDFNAAINLLNDNIDLLYCNVFLKPTNRKYDGEFGIEKLTLKNISHQAIFYRHEVLLADGGFNLKYPILSDYDLNLRLFSNKNVRKQYVDLTIAQFDENGV